MTAPITHDRETIERANQLFQRQPNLHWDTALALATDQLQGERDALAERTSKGLEMAASLEAFWSCACCRVGTAGPGAVDALCPSCRPVVAEIMAERRAEEMVNGRSRRELAAAYVDYRQQVEAP
jgi:hypothetical protein